jgi:CubicO group peptidase (beta-lactamase class C family)
MCAPGLRTAALKHALVSNVSITLQVTAALAFILMEKGYLGLDDDIAKYLPCFDHDKMRVLVGEFLVDGRLGCVHAADVLESP